MAILETAVGNGLAALGKSVWNFLRGKRRIDAEIWHYRQQIMSTTSPYRLSEILLNLKEFCNEHPDLLMRPYLREFYDAWPDDQMLDLTGQHSKLHDIDRIPDGVRELKADCVKLLRP